MREEKRREEKRREEKRREEKRREEKRNMKNSLKSKMLFLLFILGLIFSATIIFTSKPSVSVIIPTYNRANLLPRAIDSILNQTYQDFEIIVIDDASTDETATLLKEYQKKSNKIKVITHTENKGVSEARNSGYQKARGDLIALIDSDDFALKDYLKTAVQFMNDHPEVTIGVPVKYAYYDNKKNIKTFNTLNEDTFPWHYPVHRFSVYNSLGNVGNIFRKDLIKKYDIKYNDQFSCGEDYDFWMQMIINGATLAKIETTEPLVVFRAYGGLSRGNCFESDKIILNNFYKKIGYDRKNKHNDCKVFRHVIKKFPNIFPIQSDLDKIAKECPKETDVYIRAIHSKWNDYLIFSQEADTVYKQSNKDFAKILSFIPGEKITVKWDRWGEETFIYDKEKNQYICEEKK